MSVGSTNISFNNIRNLYNNNGGTLGGSGTTVSLGEFRGASLSGTIIPDSGAISISTYFRDKTFDSPEVSETEYIPLADLMQNLTDSNLGLMKTALTNAGGTMYDINSHLAYNNTSISDGGSDMYDGGNKISFNQGSMHGTEGLLVYKNAITPNGIGNGNYFVKIGPSDIRFFIFAADIDSSITNVQINGNNGADGMGSVVVGELIVISEGVEYKVYWKSIDDSRGYDPAINHVWILKHDPTNSRDYSTDTNNDYHKVNTGGVIKRIYYILWGGTTSDTHTNNTEVTALVEKFLSFAPPPYWNYLETFTNGSTNAQFSSSTDGIWGPNVGGNGNNTKKQASGTGTSSSNGFKSTLTTNSTYANPFHLKFSDNDTRYIQSKDISDKISNKTFTIEIHYIRGNSNNGGENADGGEDLRIQIKNSSGTSLDDTIICTGSSGTGNRSQWDKFIKTYTLNGAASIYIYQASSSDNGFDQYGIKYINVSKG